VVGQVYKSTGSWYEVKTSDGKLYPCRIKGKLRLAGIKSTNPIAVGDWVDFEQQLEGDQELGIIYRIQERKNYIIRKSVNLSKQVHIIASNLDQVFLLVTLNNPTTYTRFIDRFLVTAEAYDVPAILLFNKMDSYSAEEAAKVKTLIDLYTQIGYACMEISALQETGLEELKDEMLGKVSMFAGNSGVGKSTLVNALQPGLNLKTREITEQHAQGQHTTTFAEMYDLDFGARIIDTPGIKGFGIVDMEREEIGDYFPEFFSLKSDCKFNNCLHLDEPKCAVKTALENGDISVSRYRSYKQLLAGEEDSYRLDPFSENEF
jgi:ribosome biogenesis GTPase